MSFFTKFNINTTTSSICALWSTWHWGRISAKISKDWNIIVICLSSGWSIMPISSSNKREQQRHQPPCHTLLQLLDCLNELYFSLFLILIHSFLPHVIPCFNEIIYNDHLAVLLLTKKVRFIYIRSIYLQLYRDDLSIEEKKKLITIWDRFRNGLNPFFYCGMRPVVVWGYNYLLVSFTLFGSALRALSPIICMYNVTLKKPRKRHCAHKTMCICII